MLNHLCLVNGKDLEYFTLSHLLHKRRLKPIDRLIVLTETSKAVVYLHKQTLTLCEPITVDNVLVMRNNTVST